MKCVIANSNMLCKLFKADFPMCCVNKNSPASVRALLNPCGPFAVLLAIVFVVVDAVETGSFWSIAHVGQEFCKVFPCGVIGDAAPAVSVVFGMLVVVAALLHASPGNIRASACGVDCFAFFEALDTAAAYALARSKRCGQYISNCSALAPASVCNFLELACPINDSPAAKRFT